MARDQDTIVIYKDESPEASSHSGGAWKVAYADFVTAMMAFFLLMWLIRATTDDQRRGLADYFAPTNLFGHSVSGSGRPFGGKTPNDTRTDVSTSGSPQVITGEQPVKPDASSEEVETPAATPKLDSSKQEDPAEAEQELRPMPKPGGTTESGTGKQALLHGGDYLAPRFLPPLTPAVGPEVRDEGATATAQRQTAMQNDAQREQQRLDDAATQLRKAIQQDPGLQDIASQLKIERVPEGLRIQILDAERRPMFALGDATPTKRVRDLLQKVVPALAGLPNMVSIAGHTDAAVYRGQEKSNWELSSERAHAVRRLLVEAGLPDSRIRSVTGNADRDLLVPEDPLNAANRRIAIVVLKHAAVDPAGGTQ